MAGATAAGAGFTAEPERLRMAARKLSVIPDFFSSITSSGESVTIGPLALTKLKITLSEMPAATSFFRSSLLTSAARNMAPPDRKISVIIIFFMASSFTDGQRTSWLHLAVVEQMPCPAFEVSHSPVEWGEFAALRGEPHEARRNTRP